MKSLIRILQVFLALILFSSLFFYKIGDLLSSADFAEKSDVIICMSGSSDRINKAVLLLQRGLAEKVVVTTVTAYKEMLQKKVEPDRILAANWSANSTYEEGLLLKDILDKNIKSALVVSDPFHLFRVKWTFRHIFSGDLPAFSFISSDAPSFQGFWWTNLNSRLFVLGELPKIVYYWIWHGVLGIEEDRQWAVDLQRMYMAFIRNVFT